MTKQHIIMMTGSTKIIQKHQFVQFCLLRVGLFSFHILTSQLNFLEYYTTTSKMIEKHAIKNDLIINFE